MSTASVSDYCHKCKVMIMDGKCFCDWDGETPLSYDQQKKEWFEDYVLRPEEVIENREFKEKIKSINFSKVRGGGRG